MTKINPPSRQAFSFATEFNGRKERFTIPRVMVALSFHTPQARKQNSLTAENNFFPCSGLHFCLLPDEIIASSLPAEGLT